MEVLTATIREEKEISIKSIQIRREEVKLTIWRWHDTIHKNPKVSTSKLLELINEFSKVAGYKINIQKSVGFLYTNNELSESESKEKKKHQKTKPKSSCPKKNKIPRNQFNLESERPILWKL